jgi:hypothetical protein
MSIVAQFVEQLFVEVWESAKSRHSNIGREESRRTREFFIRGAPDEFSAELALAAYIPSVYGNLPFDSAEVEELLFGYFWRASVTWATPKKQDPGFATVEFDTTGGTTKITHSIRTVGSYGQGGATPPDFNNGINCSGPQNKPEGVDIHNPALKFTVAGVLSFDQVDDSYVMSLAAATGCTNNAPFGAFDTGELLFLGASGQTRKSSEDQPGVDVKWQFEASENADDLSVAGIDNISKGGHEYLWVHHVPGEDEDASQVVPVVDGVYVEQVYYDTDFGALQIPDTSQQEMPQGFPT